jgi:hypothetical protein
LWVESDLRLLRRILQNFISNAIRYTASGSVRVTCAVEGDAGARGGDRHRARHRRQPAGADLRGVPAAGHAQPGQGLGLAIVRARRTCWATASAAFRAGRGGDLCHHSAAGPRWGGQRKRSRPPRDRTMQGLRVLVVDNERQIQSGCAPCWADGDAMWCGGDEGEALRLFGQGERPDVILADYHLNDGETGDRVIARLQDHFGRGALCDDFRTGARAQDPAGGERDALAEQAGEACAIARFAAHHAAMCAPEGRLRDLINPRRTAPGWPGSPPVCG